MLKLAPGFTVVPEPPDRVWLIAGEDVRIALGGDAIAAWLPAVLAACDGATATDAVLATVPDARRAEARTLIADLTGERILVDAGVVHRSAPVAWHVEGDGRLAEALRRRAPGGGLVVVAQDTLDLGAALAANAKLRGTRWLWATIGPAARGLIGPLIVPDAGPCLRCLLDHFRLRSPLPALYDQIAAHPGPFAPADVAPAVIDVVAGLVAWKLTLTAEALAPAALYALHAVEVATLEVSSHRVLINPECPACRTPGT